MIFDSISSGLAQFAQDVVEDASVLEVLDLHVGVQTHFRLEGLPRVGRDFHLLMHGQAAVLDVDAEGLLPS